ncbi:MULTISPECIES: PAQR family membrane homeostasis protein TrhA [unclassified Janibacter]|uniref:PAQR family membrane homeostasis protein TrhA n=1 Tax=unclassified Janibacter TaxID=2649294 RepID=UPI003D036DB6
MSTTRRRAVSRAHSVADLQASARRRIADGQASAKEFADQVGDQFDDMVDAVKPHLRGWLHTVMAPLAVLAGIILTALAPTTGTRIAAAVFTVTAGLLFGVSAIYHRGNWSPKTDLFLRRFDHANIFLIIAGSYTPFATLLPRRQATTLLVIVWSGAIAGVLFRILWVNAPRWLYVPIYCALGWIAIFYIKPLFEHGGAAIVTLVAVGGLLYTLGAIVYGTKRPNPSPRWFGFHEIFHAFTIAAFTAHFIAAALATHSAAV